MIEETICTMLRIVQKELTEYFNLFFVPFFLQVRIRKEFEKAIRLSETPEEIGKTMGTVLEEFRTSIVSHANETLRLRSFLTQEDKEKLVDDQLNLCSRVIGNALVGLSIGTYYQSPLLGFLSTYVKRNDDTV